MSGHNQLRWQRWRPCREQQTCGHSSLRAAPPTPTPTPTPQALSSLPLDAQQSLLDSSLQASVTHPPTPAHHHAASRCLSAAVSGCLWCSPPTPTPPTQNPLLARPQGLKSMVTEQACGSSLLTRSLGR